MRFSNMDQSPQEILTIHPTAGHASLSVGSNIIPITNVPPELMIIIFSFLPVENVLLSVSLVCKQFHEITKSAQLWRSLLTNAFKGLVFSPDLEYGPSVADADAHALKNLYKVKKTVLVQFDPDKCHRRLYVSESGRVVIHSDPSNGDSVVMSRVGIFGGSTHYFEFVLDKIHPNNNCCIGVGIEGLASLGSYVGCNEYSWGYYKENGHRFHGGGRVHMTEETSAYGEPYEEGDTIGVLLDYTGVKINPTTNNHSNDNSNSNINEHDNADPMILDTNRPKLSFFRNGRYQGLAYSDSLPVDKPLYLMVGLLYVHDRVTFKSYSTTHPPIPPDHKPAAVVTFY